MKKLLLPILLLLSYHLSAQQLQKHHWQDRLLIIVDNTENSTKRLEQLTLFKRDKEGLKERKLLFYQFTKSSYQKGLSDDEEWLTITEKTGKINLQKSGFTLYLIGLDGGIKMEKNEVVPLEYIFTLIDGMPMRRAEMNGN